MQDLINVSVQQGFLQKSITKQLSSREKSHVVQASPGELDEPVHAFTCIPDTLKCNYDVRLCKAKHIDGGDRT